MTNFPEKTQSFTITLEDGRTGTIQLLEADIKAAKKDPKARARLEHQLHQFHFQTFEADGFSKDARGKPKDLPPQ